ncbi:PAB1-binding protein 1 [Babesia sp. Xinjiang]|uniref:PAB1-binding protein 1 n=1 Tax=Babesia sp. Xinjiang TaxID=462227 RepID=UPI000A23944F|nr:PAB1-binding protein 1 [Babesia sp. Xinjiang]ORM39989.1 PAB1-binding protein 1 [Babesia sp. Xinjiang]
MTNGRYMKGRFHSFDIVNRNNSKMVDVALRNGRFVQSKNDEGHPGNPIVVPGTDYNYVVAHGVPPTGGNSGEGKNSGVSPSRATSGESVTLRKRHGASRFKTDNEISKSKGQRQNDKLVEWTPEEPVDDSQLCSLGNQRKAEWDQFEYNRKEFGLETTYDENLYTTKLNLDEVSQQIQDQAAKLASEIAGPRGSGGYSQLETYLEQDEDAGENPAAEAAVKKVLARNMRDARRDDKRMTNAKAKSRSAAVENASGSHNTRHQGSNRAMSYKDIMANGNGNSSHMKSSGTDNDAIVNQSYNAARSEASGTKSDNNKHRNAHGEDRRAEHNGDEERMAEKSMNASEKDVDRPMTQDTKNSATTTPSKKAFAFNPNASSFTPSSSLQSSARATTSPQASVRSPVKPSQPAPKVNTSEQSGSADGLAQSKGKDPAAQTTNTANSRAKFLAFSPMVEYPKLDVSMYTKREWPITDQVFDEAWSNVSDMSYRTLIGDLSQLHHITGVVAMRPQHSMIPSAGMATVLLPQGAPVTYPTYQIGGIPLNVVPYGRQVTPKFYTSPRQSQQAIHAVAAQRPPINVNQLAVVAHPQQQVLPKTTGDRGGNNA